MITRWIHNHFVFRLGRSLGRFVNGDRLASQLWEVDVARFDVELKRSTNISDTMGMAGLRKVVQDDLSSSTQVLEQTINALTERFYFVLDVPPRLKSGAFCCQGTIRCRGRSRTVIVDLLRLQNARIKFVTDLEVLGKLSLSLLSSNICSSCNRFRRKLFNVRCVADLVNIYIWSGKERRRRISAFPQSLHWFTARQNLDSRFGSADHGSPGCLTCCDIAEERLLLHNKPALGLRKRKATVSENVAKAKRVRI
jgi:hypothetical protein